MLFAGRSTTARITPGSVAVCAAVAVISACAGTAGPPEPVGTFGAVAPASGQTAVPRPTVLEPCPTGAAGRRNQLPALTLRCLGPGPEVALSRLAGGPYVVNLWASWCYPCQQEAPRLRAAADTSRGRVHFVGIDIEDDRRAALAFVARYRISYPQLIDRRGATADALGAPGIPVTLAVDAQGRIVYRRIGEVSAAQVAAAVQAATGPLPSGPGRGR